jgi:hypothetical protein
MEWLATLARRYGASMSPAKVVRIVCWLVVVFTGVTGLWAFLGPKSFYDHLATFPPYNRHLIHDIGAFSIGLGAAVVAGMRGLSGLRVALWGAAVANVVHAISHIIDRNIGGNASQPWTLSAFAAITVVGAIYSGRIEAAPAK